MHTQFPSNNVPPLNQMYFKHSSGYSKSISFNSSPSQQKNLENQNKASSNLYTCRPSSVSVSRQQRQANCLNRSHELSKEIKIKEDAVLEVNSLENKKDQLFQQSKFVINREKHLTKSKFKDSYGETSSTNKKVIFEPGFVESQQNNRDDQHFCERKEQKKPKIPSFIKNSIPKNQNINDLNLPLNKLQQNTTREVKTDRDKVDKITKKSHALHSNMPILQNSIFRRQCSESKEMKQNNQKNELNGTQNVHLQELKQQLQIQDRLNGGNVRRVRKQMTHNFILEMSNFPLEQRQMNIPNQAQSFQNKKKNNFQFFRKIKNKKLTCVFDPPPRQFQLSDFSFIDKLGKGAFGDVFLAEQKVTGFICVIKKLSKKRIKELKLEQQIFRQIKIQSYLNHRHATSLYGFFDDQTHIYLIMQLLPDGSLAKNRRKLPQAQVSHYVRQISMGLSYLHTQKVIHRDLKPQNIFLCQNYAKIGDFGCSIYTSTFRDSQIGSLAYVSPQQLKHQLYNEKIDVWSMGIIAYEMLLGVSPFQRDIVKIARNQLAAELLQLKFPQGAVLSPQARQFLTDVLNNDPKARLDINQVLRHEFIVKHNPKEKQLV